MGKGKQARVYLCKKGRGSKPGYIEGAVRNLELLTEEVTDLDAVVGEVVEASLGKVRHWDLGGWRVEYWN